MSDTETTEVARPKISATFSRAVSDGNYGTIKAEAWVQGDVAPDATAQQISEAATTLLQVAAVAVWDQLGLAYNVDEVSGLLVEDVPDPKTTVTMPVASNVSSTSTSSVRVMNPNEQQGELPAWLLNECSKLGIGAVWDNRSKATGNQPHFKEAVPRGGRGHGKDGEPKPFWPPK